MLRWFLSLLMLACSSPSPSRLEGTKMGMDYSILIRDPDANLDQVQQEIDLVFEEVDQIYNSFNPTSSLSLMNRAEANSPFPLPGKLEKLLCLVDYAYLLTKGRFDPTILPLLNLYKKAFSQGNYPQKEEINQISMGWDLLIFEEGLCLKKAPLEIDLSGIAKGYAVDLLTEKLQQLGLSSFLVSWGGEMRAFGNKPFLVQIFGSDTLLSLENEAVATSGSYVFEWEVDGKTFSHIISKEKAPIEKGSSPLSVTCKAPTCALADAIATAFMTYKKEEVYEEAKKLIQIRPDISLFIGKSANHNNGEG